MISNCSHSELIVVCESVRKWKELVSPLYLSDTNHRYKYKLSFHPRRYESNLAVKCFLTAWQLNVLETCHLEDFYLTDDMYEALYLYKKNTIVSFREHLVEMEKRVWIWTWDNHTWVLLSLRTASLRWIGIHWKQAKGQWSGTRIKKQFHAQIPPQ